MILITDNVYSKQQASYLKQAFWTAFGQYMQPVPSADGSKINWSNYKTGIKHIYFRLEAEKDHAAIFIELSDPDEQLQEKQYEQFKQLKLMLGEGWSWAPHIKNTHAKTISMIHQQLQGVNVFNQDDWPAIISFFKPRIIALDKFWSEARYMFD